MKVWVLGALLVAGLPFQSDLRSGAAVSYRFSFPEPQHHWMKVEAVFTELERGPLELRMSRSSPGRYSQHDFAKNVYDVQAFGVDGTPLDVMRPDPHGWTVTQHGGHRLGPLQVSSATGWTAPTSPSTRRTRTSTCRPSIDVGARPRRPADAGWRSSRRRLRSGRSPRSCIPARTRWSSPRRTCST